MKVLVACEFSGVVRDAFLSRGHDAISCDLLPTESPGPHYEGDVRDILYEDWDLVIAHPTCTYLTNAGVHHLYGPMRPGDSILKGPERWKAAFDGAQFFKMFWELPGPVCVENPIMHKYAKHWIDPSYRPQIVQPWMFGHTEKKATCLWLKGLPHLAPTSDVRKQMESMPKSQTDRVHRMSPSDNRGKLRSITYQGIAEAMSIQWPKALGFK